MSNTTILFSLASALTSAEPGAVEINGKVLGSTEVRSLSSALGAPVPAGRYWYDSRSGLWGLDGQGYAGRIAPGLPLPPLSPSCSNGTTGVFVNGREITLIEHQQLMMLVGQLLPGRYFINADGGAGREGGPVMVNLLEQGQGRGGGGISSRGMLSNVDGYSSGGETYIRVTDHMGNHTSWSN